MRKPGTCLSLALRDPRQWTDTLSPGPWEEEAVFNLQGPLECFQNKWWVFCILGS